MAPRTSLEGWCIGACQYLWLVLRSRGLAAEAGASGAGAVGLFCIRSAPRVPSSTPRCKKDARSIMSPKVIEDDLRVSLVTCACYVRRSVLGIKSRQCRPCGDRAGGTCRRQSCRRRAGWAASSPRPGLMRANNAARGPAPSASTPAASASLIPAAHTKSRGYPNLESANGFNGLVFEVSQRKCLILLAFRTTTGLTN